jgi:glycolate oxidase FAD binding subunit
VIPAGALRELRETLGAERVDASAAGAVDGEPMTATLTPPDAASLAETLRTLARLSLPCVIRGGGSRLALGNPPRGARLLLSTASLRGLEAFEADEGVCRAQAGTPLAALEAALADSPWRLPLDPPGEGSTLGGALACAALGPRAQGFGRPRDCVLGLEVVLADGSRTRCGGRVVKNVTGYDLNKLYTGSLGTLGVITGAWLRLRPRPERVSLLAAAPADPALACAGALAAARRPSARAASLAAEEAGGGLGLVVELAGDAESVERDAAWCAAELGAREAEPGALEGVRALPGSTPECVGMRFRLALRPSRCETAFTALRRAGARVLAYPGLGLVYAGFALSGEGDPAAAEAFACVGALAARLEGASLLEAAPAWTKRGRDVFGEVGDGLALMRRLKQRFDPAGLLNPGRFAGHA